LVVLFAVRVDAQAMIDRRRVAVNKKRPRRTPAVADYRRGLKADD
jgi:hypothetical protein